MSFNLAGLPLELIFEILRLGATPALAVDCNNRILEEDIYSCARALALVCSNVRQVVMPHLLHTVVLNSDRSLNLFLRTLKIQISWARQGSRLRLNYTELVRHIWSSACYEPLLLQHNWAYPSYDLLWNIFRNSQTIGFNFAAIHLLYEVITATPYNTTFNDWTCSRVTFAGYIPRWNAITSNSRGMEFLQQITHLTVWAPHHDIASPQPEGVIPNWFYKLPFQFIPRLQKLSFTLVGPQDAPTTPVLIYTLPSSDNGTPADTFQTWARSSDPLSWGQVFHLNVPYRVDVNVDMDARDLAYKWEMAYYLGQNDVWSPSATQQLRQQ